jgi:hypothetical protein
MLKTKKLLLTLQMLLIQASFFAQDINAELLTISCGNNYFSVTGTTQPPLVVRGWWCGESYMWTPVSVGDTLKELAYVDDELFTGKAIATDSLGNTVAWYVFENGYLNHIEEFNGVDQPRNSLNFKNGIPHGVQRCYDWNGELYLEKNFNEGILDGSFYWSKERVDSGLPPCIETGIFRNGVYERTSEPCEFGD